MQVQEIFFLSRLNFYKIEICPLLFHGMCNFEDDIYDSKRHDHIFAYGLEIKLSLLPYLRINLDNPVRSNLTEEIDGQK